MRSAAIKIKGRSAIKNRNKMIHTRIMGKNSPTFFLPFSMIRIDSSEASNGNAENIKSAIKQGIYTFIFIYDLDVKEGTGHSPFEKRGWGDFLTTRIHCI